MITIIPSQLLLL